MVNVDADRPPPYAAGAASRQSKIYDWPADGLSSAARAGTWPGGARDAGSQGSDLQSGRAVDRTAPTRADPAGRICWTPHPLFSGSQPDARYFDLSPDGKLLAFTVADANTAQTNVFVTTYPGLSERLQITSNGGTSPRFARRETALLLDRYARERYPSRPAVRRAHHAGPAGHRRVHPAFHRG